MMYLSQLLGMPVEDEQGERIGKISDVLVPLARVEQAGTVYPSALLLAGVDIAHPWRVPPRDVAWQGASLRLHVSIDQLSAQSEEVSSVQEVSLAREVLDRQVIDIGRKKTVRVNDICFAETWQILGIDNSTLGLVRRLAPTWLLGVKSKQAPTNLIPWSRIELIEASQPEDDEQAIGADLSRPPIVRMQSGQLAELRPADIAEIVHQLTPEQGARLIEGLDDETAADAMQEVDTGRQRHILENIEAERAADILQAMEPDEAADLLAQLPEERAAELLSLMTPEESEDVQELLEYEADTAGGLMTTSYLALGQDSSAAQALDALRERIQSEEMRAAYIYCVDDETREEQRLLGVVSVWRLLITPPTQSLREIMLTDLITVQPDTDPPTVAQIMAKYNLLAVPVVNEAGLIEGIVTIDDVLDVLLPPDKRRRPPRMY
jgi:magnesium transporter